VVSGRGPPATPRSRPTRAQRLSLEVRLAQTECWTGWELHACFPLLVPKTASALCNQPVFVDDPAYPVVSADSERVKIYDDRR